MSGRRPDTTKVWNFIDHFRENGVGANWTTLPQYFKKHGYATYASGKLFHPSKPPRDDYPQSWTVDASNPYYWGNQDPIGDAGGCMGQNINIAPASGSYGSTAACYSKNDTAALNDHDNRNEPQKQQNVEYDHRLATRTIEWLTKVHTEDAPFYIGVGFRKPHLQWRVPHRFYELYENVTIDVAKVQEIGEGVPVLAYEMNGEMGQVYTKDGKKYQESPHGPSLPTELQQALRHGYYAAVSFMDFEVGRILDALDQFGLTDNTIVMFHADHGWKLGEHGDWSKCSNWELDARVPFIIRAPFIKASVGAHTWAFAELVDMYPTLVELSGLPLVPVSEGLEGTSLASVLHDPSASAPHNKTMAFSQYPRCPEYNMVTQSTQWECLQTPKENITRMGFSIRTELFRLTEWRIWTHQCKADWTDNGLVAVELYAHEGDMGKTAATFDNFEFKNLNGTTEFKHQQEELSALLRTQFYKDGASC